MDAQLSLFGPPPRHEGQRDTLFFALQVPATREIVAAADELRVRYALRGALRSHTLHLSLLGLGLFDNMPRSRLALASRPGLAANIAPLALTFGEATSLQASRNGKHPLALICDDDGTDALRALTEQLQIDLHRRGIKPPNRPPGLFHITLLYDECAVRERVRVPVPIRLDISHVTLIRSRVGRGEHVALAHYPLG